MIVVVMADQDDVGNRQESSGSAAGRTRRGPRRPNGPAWVVNTGSVRITIVRGAQQEGRVADERGRDGPGTTCEGGGYGVSGMDSGHADCSRVRCHVMTSPRGRAWSPAGLKNRSPSQWSETVSARVFRPRLNGQ